MTTIFKTNSTWFEIAPVTTIEGTTKPDSGVWLSFSDDGLNWSGLGNFETETLARDYALENSK